MYPNSPMSVPLHHPGNHPMMRQLHHPNMQPMHAHPLQQQQQQQQPLHTTSHPQQLVSGGCNLMMPPLPQSLPMSNPAQLASQHHESSPRPCSAGGLIDLSTSSMNGCHQDGGPYACQPPNLHLPIAAAAKSYATSAHSTLSSPPGRSQNTLRLAIPNPRVDQNPLDDVSNPDATFVSIQIFLIAWNKHYILHCRPHHRRASIGLWLKLIFNEVNSNNVK